MKKLLFLSLVFGMISCKKEPMPIPHHRTTETIQTHIWIIDVKIHTTDMVAFSRLPSEKIYSFNDEFGVNRGESIYFSDSTEQFSFTLHYDSVDFIFSGIGGIHGKSFVMEPVLAKEDELVWSTINICNDQQRVPIEFTLHKVEKL